MSFIYGCEISPDEEDLARDLGLDDYIYEEEDDGEEEEEEEE